MRSTMACETRGPDLIAKVIIKCEPRASYRYRILVALVSVRMSHGHLMLYELNALD